MTSFFLQMEKLGFDGYALDYVDYPAGMKWFLMRDINLHRAVNCYFSFFLLFPTILIVALLRRLLP